MHYSEPSLRSVNQSVFSVEEKAGYMSWLQCLDFQGKASGQGTCKWIDSPTLFMILLWMKLFKKKTSYIKSFLP